MKIGNRIFALLFTTGVCLAQAPMPKAGYIPDKKTAITVAIAVLSPIYGEEIIRNERPFSATLKNGVWTVSGSLPPQVDGGVAEIHLDKRTGAILSYIHGK